MFLVSIRRTTGNWTTLYSVDIRPFDYQGVIAPCGNCRLFRFVGDALIFVTESTGNDIPANWPNLETHNWQNDYIQTIGLSN